jgi:VWFA-related protein
MEQKMLNHLYIDIKETPRLLLSIILFSLIFFNSAAAQHAEENITKSLEYKVDANAQLIPLFAVDNQGDPVYDLRPEEVELLVDGKLSPIIYFRKYKMTWGKAEDKQANKQFPERLNFIIIDTLISNLKTTKPAQAIAAELISGAPPGDAFVIMESNQISGFRYVVGPSKNKPKLLEAIKKLDSRYMKRRLQKSKNLPSRRYVSIGKERAMANQLHKMDSERASREEERYQKDDRIFAHSLQQLRYALKTTTLPKMVCLISAGTVEKKSKRKAAIYLQFLGDAAKAINYGGGILHLINPLKQKKQTDVKGLQFMANAVGGKIYAAASINQLISRIKNSTSAYYELAYIPAKEKPAKSRITVIPKRKGMQLTTVAYNESSRPYRLMKTIERKLFVLNVVNGGNWSRMVAEVAPIPYRMYKPRKAQKNVNRVHYIEVLLPPKMRDKDLHIYTVDFDPVSKKADTRLIKRKASQKEKFPILIHKEKRQYFVIIEPTTTRCIYNQVYNK